MIILILTKELDTLKQNHNGSAFFITDKYMCNVSQEEQRYNRSKGEYDGFKL